MTATMAPELLELAFRAARTHRPRVRLTLCSLADLAESESGVATCTPGEIAENAGLPLRSALLSMEELDRHGVIDVAFAGTIAADPEEQQRYLLNVALLRERAGLHDRVEEAVDAFRSLGATVVEDDA